jgi:hypothetical protein
VDIVFLRLEVDILTLAFEFTQGKATFVKRLILVKGVVLDGVWETLDKALVREIKVLEVDSQVGVSNAVKADLADVQRLFHILVRLEKKAILRLGNGCALFFGVGAKSNEIFPVFEVQRDRELVHSIDLA